MLPVVTKQKKTHVIVPISRTFLKGYMAAGNERKLVLWASSLQSVLLSLCTLWHSFVHVFGVGIELKALNKSKTIPAPGMIFFKHHQQNHIKTKIMVTRNRNVLCRAPELTFRCEPIASLPFLWLVRPTWSGLGQATADPWGHFHQPTGSKRLSVSFWKSWALYSQKGQMQEFN